MELAALELKRKFLNLGIGIGLGIGAALFGLFALGFGLATLAAVLAIWLSTWLALLSVCAVVILLGGVLSVLASARLKKGAPPVPVQAIEEAKLISEALKSDDAAV